MKWRRSDHWPLNFSGLGTFSDCLVDSEGAVTRGVVFLGAGSAEFLMTSSG
jgi:hypothetical protein